MMTRIICFCLATLVSLSVSPQSGAMDGGELAARTRVESKSSSWDRIFVTLPFLVGAAVVGASWLDAQHATNDACDKLKEFEDKYGNIAEIEQLKYKLEHAKRLKMADQWMLVAPPVLGAFSKDPKLFFGGIGLSGFLWPVFRNMNCVSTADHVNDKIKTYEIWHKIK